MNRGATAWCPNCGRDARHRRYMHRPGYLMRRCTSCGVIALVPAQGAASTGAPTLAPAAAPGSAPSPAAEDDPGEAWAFGIYHRVAGSLLYQASRLLAWGEDLVGRRGSLRVLDVGCGPGFLVRAALDRGHEAQGIDASPEAVRAAGGLCGAERIKAGRFEDGLPAGPFDLVFCTNVIEHLPGPGALFCRARAVLEPRGILIIETPTADALMHVANRLAYVASGGRVFRPPLGPGGHLWLFAPRSLAALGRRHGFVPLATRRTGVSLREMLGKARLLQGRRAPYHLALLVLWPLAATIRRPHLIATAFRPGPG